MSGESINLSKFASIPFRYSVGDTFNLPILFSYDVDDVVFEMKIYNASGATEKTFPDADWVLSGTRKKTLTKTPAQFNLAPGVYRLVITHTFPDGTVRKRFDSVLTVSA